MKIKYSQLISVKQLKSLLMEPTFNNLIVLDASIKDVNTPQANPMSWPDVVIANSQRFDLKNNFSDQKSTLPYTMPTSMQFQQQARLLGINKDSQVVIYDDIGLYSAPRAWWMFKAMGFSNVAVLDGGLPEWLAQGERTNNSHINQLVVNGNFVANQSEQHFCDKEGVKKTLLINDQIVIDARSAKRFTGEDKDPRVGVRNGHIPNSFNLPFSQLQHQGKMLSKHNLRAKLSKLISEKDKIVFSCGSGITACILALAADICGYQQITVYDGSWSDWGGDHSYPIGP
jgi:thiosulfate/3-mercaptopyruvate sulfurtransferase